MLLRAIAADPDDAMNMYNVACVYARTGKIEEAIDCLEKSVGKGMAEIDWMVNDSDLDNLRDHPRFGFIQLLAAEYANIGYGLSTSKRPDLVVTDIFLPGMNGPQTR